VWKSRSQRARSGKVFCGFDRQRVDPFFEGDGLARPQPRFAARLPFLKLGEKGGDALAEVAGFFVCLPGGRGDADVLFETIQARGLGFCFLVNSTQPDKLLLRRAGVVCGSSCDLSQASTESRA
jgi:hypothetical protein